MLKDNLPPEPNPSDKTVLLKIRFRDGTTRQRRFLLSQTIRVSGHYKFYLTSLRI